MGLSVRPSVRRSVRRSVRYASSFSAISACLLAPRGQYWLLFFIFLSTVYQVFKATVKIPFFKHFLRRKSFDVWRRNARRASFLRRRDFLKRRLLFVVAPFGRGVLEILNLLQQLVKAEFLPYEAKKCYTLEEFKTASLDKSQVP